MFTKNLKKEKFVLHYGDVTDSLSVLNIIEKLAN